MVSRLWLKNRKLDKFDRLDSSTELSLKPYSKEEWTLLQSFYAESVQKRQLNFLLEVISFDCLMCQKSSHNKLTNLKKFITVFSKLRKQKLYVLLDLFFNSLFLSNSWGLISDKSRTLLKIKNVNELRNLLDNFNLHNTKLLLNREQNLENTIQVNVKNSLNSNFYKKFNKGE